MCSAPKCSLSTTRRRKPHKSKSTEDYQAEARILRNASACYERNQALKAAKQLAKDKVMQNETDAVCKTAASNSKNPAKRTSMLGKLVSFLKVGSSKYGSSLTEYNRNSTIAK